VIAAIVDLAEVGADDLVVDLGAGRGALIGPLRDRGARVLAVELDRGSAAHLRRVHADDHGVEVRHDDALRVALPTEPFRVVANPPFGRSTDVVRRLVSADVPLVAATLVLQLDAARRLSGDHGSGTFSLSWTPWFDLTVVDRIDRSAFRPVPSVDAALLTVRPRTVPWLSPASCTAWQAFVAGVFRAQGRTAADRLDVVLGGSVARTVTRRADVRTVRAPSRLPPEAWLALFRALAPGDPAGGRGPGGPPRP
jgi:23S rRNA (adenine-N6)-dimethyltransferase